MGVRPSGTWEECGTPSIFCNLLIYVTLPPHLTSLSILPSFPLTPLSPPPPSLSPSLPLLPLQSLYDFAYTSDNVPQRFTLVTNFPKKELHCCEDGGPALDQLALGPKCVIFMKDESD